MLAMPLPRVKGLAPFGERNASYVVLPVQSNAALGRMTQTKVRLPLAVTREVVFSLVRSLILFFSFWLSLSRFLFLYLSTSSSLSPALYRPLLLSHSLTLWHFHTR